jgi:hypothetical protein
MHKWIKKGLIYVPNQKHEWNQTHAQVPVVDCVNDEVWRIYFATRNLKSQSATSYIEVEANNPSNILYDYNDTILPFGKLGTFDESGIMPTCIVNHKGIKYLYYIGWMLRTAVPYHNSIGLAVSDDDGKSFKKMFEGPILTTTHNEPYFCGTAYVIIENGIWRMWYLSCTKWEIINNKPEAFYHIKYAESLDGINWKREGKVAIDFSDDNEAGLVSASIIRENGKYKMWFGYRKGLNYRTDRNQSYKIGYAESADGINWNRMDHLAGIELSEEGWDSQMISYPYIVKGSSQNFMFYNGNGFGASGFGYAVQ